MHCRSLFIVFICFFPMLINAEPIKLETRRELFVDDYVIDTGALKNSTLMIHKPTDSGDVFQCEKESDRPYSMCFTSVVKDGSRYLLYYRTWPDAKKNSLAWRCAVSKDGRNWQRPNFGLCESNGSKKNNIVLASPGNIASFAPFVDTRPGIPASQRFKAVALAIGGEHRQLFAYASPDGIRWSLMSNEPIMDEEHGGLLMDPAALDTHNCAFYSETEKRYVMYVRDWRDKIRRISRSTSRDFLKWTRCRLMEYRFFGNEQRHGYDELYINSTHPYFRAPHIYLAPAARLVLNKGGEIKTQAEARKLGVDLTYFKKNKDHSSYAIFMTTRGNLEYDRLLPGEYITPSKEIGRQMARSNYPGPHYVQTGARELSLYVSHNYASTTNHLRRYTLRLDGFGSLHAEKEQGEAATKALTFTGKHLYLNYKTAAGGRIAVELTDDQGKPLKGFTQADAVPLTGNKIEGRVAWKSGPDLTRLIGTPIRIRFILQNADIYAMRFGDKE